MMPSSAFVVAASFRVPGLGLLVLPTAPAPAWLGAHPLHTALLLRLHRSGQPSLSLPATIEELARDDQPPARALLLDADPGGPLPAGAWLEITDTEQKGLL
jgi:hypothetical protein